MDPKKENPLLGLAKIQIGEIVRDGEEPAHLAAQKERKPSTLVSSSGSYEMIKVGKAGANDCVGLITLNRPKALNALCKQLMDELADSLQDLDKDNSVAAIVITGSEKAFAGKFSFIIIYKIIYLFIQIMCNFIQ